MDGVSGCCPTQLFQFVSFVSFLSFQLLLFLLAMAQAQSGEEGDIDEIDIEMNDGAQQQPQPQPQPQAEPIDYEELSKDAIKRLIKGGTVIARRKNKDKYLSPAWNTVYELIVAETKAVVKRWVECQRCGTILSGTSSTGSLNQHLASKGCGPDDPKQTTLIKAPEIVVSMKDKKQLTMRCAQMSALDLTPFSLVTKPGFKLVAREIFKLGAKYPKLSQEGFDKMIPVGSTVSRNCIAAKEQAEAEQGQYLFFVSFCFVVLFVCCVCMIV